MSADQCACDCCEPPVPPAPRAVHNPPGLPAVEYRIGTHATFRQALVERLASAPALRGLTTRDESDYAIALLDSWAYVADILTFYSERGVNETFLRTARLRESIVHLADLVGYDPGPGLSATAALAFALDVRARFVLAAGTRVQSVPPPGDPSPPVKFETLEELAGDGALSRVELIGPPTPIAQLAAGDWFGYLPPSFPPPPEAQPGATLAAWSESGDVELKRLDAVAEERPTVRLEWSPPLQQTHTYLSLARRALKIFGHDAPPSFVATQPPAGNQLAHVVELVAGGLRELGSEKVPYDFNLATPVEGIDLDREYEALSAGAQLLIADPVTKTALVRSVAAVTTVNVRFGPLRETVTHIKLSTSIGGFLDRRNVEIYELGDDVPLWGGAPPPNITGAVVHARLEPDHRPERGRAVVLADARGRLAAARVVAAQPATDFAGYMTITISPPLAQSLDARTAFMLANVVSSSHGAAVADELLGTGDATVPNQRFRLAKAPLARVPEPGAPHGGRAAIAVRVDGLRYHERERLYGAGADERVFVVDTDEDGTQHVRFGDGVQGARLPTGVEVRADYRSGLGIAGNVGAGTLSSPLTRPKGLKGVFNPFPAAGGADAETAEQARVNAPNTVRTFDRIVSLQDVEDQARANALVAKAHAAWTWVAGEPGVVLTVAGPAGAALAGDQLADLRSDLDARRDPNRALRVRGYEPLALDIEVRLVAIDPDRRAGDVRDGVRDALLAHFSFTRRSFGQPVRLSEVFIAAQGAMGARGIDVQRLTLADQTKLAAHQLDASVAVQERIDLHPDELATLAAADLVVTGP